MLRRLADVWVFPVSAMLALATGCDEAGRDFGPEGVADLGDDDDQGEGPDDDGQDDEETTTAIGSGAVLLGMHSPPWDEIAEMQTLFAGARGWLVDVVYSTDIDWLPAAPRYTAAAAAGYEVVLRVDYARSGDASFADGTPTLGATIPPPGQVGWCLIRPGGPSRYVGDGSHLDCYLHYIDDLVAANPGVHGWVIGNEMNIVIEALGHPGGVIDPAWYAEVYTAARARIHGHPGHGDDLVYLGGVSPGSANTVKTHGGNEYLGAVLDALTPAQVDAISIHAYGGWAQPQHNGGVLARDLFRNTYIDQLQFIDQKGYACEPVLITEFSAHTHVGDPAIYDEPHTADFIADAMLELHQWNGGPSNHRVLGAVWFTWRDLAQFETESMARFFDQRHQPGQTSANNPALRFTEVAPLYAARMPDCTDEPGPGPDPGPGPSPDPSPDPGPGPSPDPAGCPCLPGYDNVCFYLGEHSGCQALMGKSACTSDADWVEGYYLYQDQVCAGGPTPEPEPEPQTCPCLPGVDNFCDYGPKAPGCAMTWPGGYCDPNGDQSFVDGDWGRGWTEHAAQCG